MTREKLYLQVSEIESHNIKVYYFKGTLSAFSVENLHDGKIFENYTRFEWGVEVGVVTIFMLRLFVPHEFDMCNNIYS